MKRTPYFVFLLTALLTSSLARAGDPDFEIVTKTTLSLDERSDKWVIFSQTHEKRTYLSKRSTYASSITLGEQYYNQVSRISAYYNGDAVPDGNYSVASSDDADVFISDYKRRKIIFSRNIKVGATAELNYHRFYSSAVFMPVMTVPNLDRIKEYTVVVEHPRDVDVGFELFFPHGPIPYTIDSSEPKETVITFTNVGAVNEMVGYPFNGFRAAIKINARKDGNDITPSSPQGFSRWYLGLFDQSPQLPPDLDTLLRSSLAKARDPIEKLRIIHDYVRETIRYIAEEDDINAFVPRPPALVLKRGYGDCKDRAYLVRTLAKREGIDVKMVLVSTEPQPIFNSVDVSRYGHVICMYEGPTGRIYFDPTSKYTPLGTLPTSSIGSEGLVLDTLRAERVMIDGPASTPSIEVSIAAKLGELKKGKATVRLRGSAIEIGNAAAERRRAIDRENYLSNYITRYFSKISFDYFEVESQTDSVITLTCEADLSDFLIASDTRQYLPQMPFRILSTELLDRENDSLPIYTSPAQLAMTIDLEHPGYAADASSVTFGTESARGFSTSLASTGREASRIRFETSYTQGTVPQGAKREYFDFCRSMFKLKKNLYILNRRGS